MNMFRLTPLLYQKLILQPFSILKLNVKEEKNKAAQHPNILCSELSNISWCKEIQGLYQQK